jgi:NAD(P)H-flavin reductase
VLVVTVPIARVQAITPRSRLITLDLQGHSLPFLPGQAVMIGAHGHGERRPYSIASSPEQVAETGRLELLIAADASAVAGQHLSPATSGTLVDVEGPEGRFILPRSASTAWLLFVAGGTGIAPLRSMLDHLLRRGAAHRLSLLYSARSGDEFAFIEELQAHSAAGLLELHQTVTRDDTTWTGRRGRIGRAHFEAVLHEPADTLCFVCGPTALVDESVGTLQALGVQEAQIKTESWGR